MGFCHHLTGMECDNCRTDKGLFDWTEQRYMPPSPVQTITVFDDRYGTVLSELAQVKLKLDICITKLDNFTQRGVKIKKRRSTNVRSTK